MTPEPSAAPPDHRLGLAEGAANIVKGLSLQNVLIIALLVVIAIPAYTIYQALHDDKLLDRFLSTYEEITSQNIGCTMRHLQRRGGTDQWSVSSGFAYQGADRWVVSVWMDHEPNGEEVNSYCESLKLIADRMVVVRGRDDADAADQ
jgi:hypothetical protein